METYNWKQKGNLYLWRYENNPKNYPGWHLTGDMEGISSLCTLLTIMQNEGRNVKRTVQLSLPTSKELSILGCSSKAIPEKKVVIHLEIDEPIEWCIKPYGDSMDIIANPYSIKGFVKSLNERLQGENDFSFSHGENQIWFW